MSQKYRKLYLSLAAICLISMTACSTSPAASSPDVPTETAAQAGTAESAEDSETETSLTEAVSEMESTAIVPYEQLVYPENEVAHKETRYTYDAGSTEPKISHTYCDAYGNQLCYEVYEVGAAEPEVFEDAYEYTEDGQIAVHYDLNPDSAFYTVTQYSYDADGRVISEYEYDSTGDKQQRIHVYADGSKGEPVSDEDVSIYYRFYDDYENQIRSENELGVTLSETRYEYDAAGNPIVIRDYDLDRSSLNLSVNLWTTKYQEFDENGSRISSRIEYAEPSGTFIPLYADSVFAYDENGNRILEECQDTYQDGSKGSVRTFLTTYDEDGNIVKMEHQIDGTMDYYIEYEYEFYN